jgi:hypothetical protein
MVNINIEIPDELHRRLKLDSVLQGTTLKEHIIAILDEDIPSQDAASLQEAAKKANGGKKG